MKAWVELRVVQVFVEPEGAYPAEARAKRWKEGEYSRGPCG